MKDLLYFAPVLFHVLGITYCFAWMLYIISYLGIDNLCDLFATQSRDKILEFDGGDYLDLICHV